MLPEDYGEDDTYGEASGEVEGEGTGVEGGETHWRVERSKVKIGPGVSAAQGVSNAPGVR
jgi:hypothetical protein